MSAVARQLDASSSAATGVASPALRAIGLEVRLDGRRILQDLTFATPRARVTALLGPNGAGKSTLLRTLATLIRPSRGSLLVLGSDAAVRNETVRSRIGLIGHQTMLYRDLSAMENLVLFGRLYAVPNPRRRAADLLEFVGLTAGTGDPVRTLSRGAAQRVAIARALVHDPDLLLADEPFTGLDAAAVGRIGDRLAGLASRGTTVLLANHDIRHALDLSERVLVLRGGRLVLDVASASTDERTVLKAMEDGP